MAPRGEGAPGIPDGADISAARERAKKSTELEKKVVYPPADVLMDAPEAEALNKDIATAKATVKQEAMAMADADPSHMPKGHETPRPGRGIEAKTQERAARQRVGEMDVTGFGSTSPEQRAEMAEMQSVIADYDAQINTVKGLIEANPQDWQNLVSANPELGAVLTMTGEEMNRARTDVDAIKSQSSFVGRLFSGAKRRELREAQGNLARMENNLSEAYNALAALTGAAGERLMDRTTATSPETSQVRGASYEVASARSGGRARRVEETPELTPEELAQTQEMPALTEEENERSITDLEEVVDEEPVERIKRGGAEAQSVKHAMDVRMGGVQERAARQRVGEMDVTGFGSTSPEQRAEMAEMQSVIADYDGQINTVKGLIEQNPGDWQNLVSANPELGTILTMTGADMNRARTDLEAVQSQSSFFGRLFSGAKRRELREAQGNLARMESNLSEAYNALAALTGAAGERLADRTTAASPETSQVRGASYEVAAARSGGRARRVEETPELTPEELAQTQEMPALTEEENLLSPEDLEEVTTAQRLVDYAPEGIRSILEGIASGSVSPEVAFDLLEEEEGFVDWNSDLVGKILDGVKDGRGKAMEGVMTIKAVRKNSSGKPTVYLQREDGKNLTMGFANFLKNNVQ